MKQLTAGDADADASCRKHVAAFAIDKLESVCEAKDPVEVNFGGKTYQLKPKEHFVVGPAEASWLKK